MMKTTTTTTITTGFSLRARHLVGNVVVVGILVNREGKLIFSKGSV